jgi:hypothetical protein
MTIEDILQYLGLKKQSIMKKYLNDMHKQHNYFATWPVYEYLELGDVGTLQNNLFTKVTNLDNLGIKFEKEDPGYKADLIYTSDGKVKQLSKSNAGAAPFGVPKEVLNADLSIYFENSNSIYLNVPDITITHIKDKNSLGFKILDRYNENNNYSNNMKWNLDWVVITDLQYAKTAIFLLSSSDNSYAALEAGAKNPLLGKNLEWKLITQSSKNVSMQAFPKDIVTPLFNAIKLENVSWDIFKTDNEPKNVEVKTLSYLNSKGLLKESGSIILPMDIRFQNFDLESSE